MSAGGLLRIRALAGASLVLIAACQSSSGGRPGDSTSGDVATTAGAEDARLSAVRLERQPCFGTCPVYVVDVDSAGHVRFEGRAHVRAQGKATADISKDAFRAMSNHLVAAGVLSFDSAYTAGAPGCGLYATDMPVVILSVVVGDTTKRVVHDYGCSGAPTALRGLHRMVDSVANTSRWLLD
jgi:hypothetical protein